MELGFSTQSRQQAVDTALRQRLLNCVNQESEQFIKLADAFYAQDLRDEESSIAICQEIVALVHRVTSIEGWQQSKFLKNIMKPLLVAQKQAQGVLDRLDIQNNVVAHYELPLLTDDQVLVYIMVFQTDGYDMKHWSLQLSNLDSHLVGRPIYDTEEVAAQVIREKELQVSDAYVVCAVTKSSLLQDQWALERVDASGRPLVSLPPQSISEEAIREFVHMKKRYYWIDSKLELIKKSEDD